MCFEDDLFSQKKIPLLVLTVKTKNRESSLHVLVDEIKGLITAKRLDGTTTIKPSFPLW
jgi:hypothetical protein